MLRHFLDDFMSFVPCKCRSFSMWRQWRSRSFTATTFCSRSRCGTPHDLEEVMDIFEDDMELITLYTMCRSDWKNPVIAPVPTPIPLSDKCSR